MKHGVGHKVIVIRKEEDNIYWGKTESGEIKFKSDKDLKDGEKRFVHLSEVIDE